MGDLDTKYWELINNFEDYVSYGCKTGRKLPEVVLRKTQTETPDSMALIASEIEGCTKCGLCKGRHKTVPGMGVRNPDILVVGEGPGADEDAQGLPFVGKAGRYLDKWLAAIALDRGKNCFIGNIVKCRPPGNRDPQPDEITACIPYLERQIAVLKPKFILTVGKISSSVLSGIESGIGRLRGSTYLYKGIPLIPTYHPSAVLRDPTLRKPVWEDLKRLKAEFEDLKNE